MKLTRIASKMKRATTTAGQFITVLVLSTPVLSCNILDKGLEATAPDKIKTSVLETPSNAGLIVTSIPLTDEPLVADMMGSYYAGKLVRDSAGALYFMAWRQWDEGGNFCGGLSDPADVHILPDGRLQVDPQQLWTVKAC